MGRTKKPIVNSIKYMFKKELQLVEFSRKIKDKNTKVSFGTICSEIN